MWVKKLKLRNFRCFGPEETVLNLDDTTTFIGMNSSGKTAALQALVKLFGNSSSVRELKRADFHISKGKKPENVVKNDLYIEAIITFPELETDDQTAKATIPLLFQQMTVSGTGESPYVRIRLVGTWQAGNSPDGEIEQELIFITIAEDENESDFEEHTMRVTANHQSMIEVIYVPAVRNPSEQLRNASGTILWRVLNGINWPEDIDTQVANSGKELGRIFDDIPGFQLLETVMGKQWGRLHSDVRYNQIKVGVNNDDLRAILQRFDVRFFPTELPDSYNYNVDELGEGLKSLFYLSLVSSLLEIEDEVLREKQNSIAQEDDNENSRRVFNDGFRLPALTILAIEEPENHIAPHLLGRVMENLKQVSSQDNAQVIITSHTPAIVKRVQPENIRHLQICKERHCTVVNSIKLPSEKDEAYKYIKEAVLAYPELYFARLVVLGEGDTEEIVIPKALNSVEESLDAGGICVAPLGGRYVNHFWKLLTQLSIPYITLLDLDLERETGGWAKIKYVIKQLIENGVNQQELFDALQKGGILVTNENLEEIHTWGLDKGKIDIAVKILRSYDVFFAEPLDMDFMMLEAFEEVYKSLVPENGGPRRTEAQAIKATLKFG